MSMAKQSEAYCFFPTPAYIVQAVNQTNTGFTVSCITLLFVVYVLISLKQSCIVCIIIIILYR